MLPSIIINIVRVKSNGAYKIHNISNSSLSGRARGASSVPPMDKIYVTQALLSDPKK